jgi:hydrogenase maturation protein HypF
MPGGALAIRQPWRMACSWLTAISPESPPLPAVMAAAVDEQTWAQVAALADAGLNAPVTTSMGRLFDAVSALCGVRAQVSYEGQAAVELEALCDPAERGSYPFALDLSGEALVIDPREAIRAIAADVTAGEPVSAIATRFHTGVADATVHACSHAALAHGTDLVVLSGGVWQNRRLLETAAAGLRSQGLRVLIPERLPVNDGGISYGQAVVAARRTATSGR